MGWVRRQLGGVKQRLTPSGPGPTQAEATPPGQPDFQVQIRRLRQRVVALEERLGEEQDGRVEQLEAEIQELRALGGRVAELADLVTEVLAVKARNDPALKETLRTYVDGV